MRDDTRKKLLDPFYTFYYLTPQQVTTHLYSETSATGVNKSLLLLTEEGYLHRRKHNDKNPNEPLIYWLSLEGRKVLPYDFSDWRPPSKMEEHIKYSHIWHTLGINDFLITVLQLPCKYPHIKIEVYHDFTLKRMMLGSPAFPDSIIKFLSGQCPILWLEWDNDEEKEKLFKSKIRRIVGLVQYGFDSFFATPVEAFTWVFVTPKENTGRRDEMRKWGEEVLIEMHMERLGQQFMFGALPPKLDTSLFFEPIWSQAFDDGKHSLLSV